ncbi:cytochrome P450 [Ruixingdingia sedimenti]|uniref:Cytochrome P450 n=1 Tax=Ruixingdingia sedimenti TaxID=3073604 RepID=A0ABU1F3Q6_9RHOB|nr:cytochrome P450 [Xinfangfangia sp. LG-4]MDR5651492.1 cytochrome P450 [Xinfangfangia sp. LG-4]
MPDDMLTGAPVLDLDPYALDTLREPWGFHAALRDTGPVVWIPKYDMYAVGRHDELRQVMSDYRRFTTTGGIGMSDIRKPGAWRSPSPITELDPPAHTPVRAAMNRILSPLIIRQWREVFTQKAEALADRVVEAGEVDAVKDIAEAFVLDAFLTVLGVDFSPEEFLVIGDMNFNQQGPKNALFEESMRQAEPIMARYQAAIQRENILPGGFAEQILLAEDRGEFAPGTGPLQVRSFLRAGVDTTISGIGHALHYLARDPAQWAALRADPGKAKPAFEEAIRLESPAANLFRTTVDAGAEISGLHLKGATKVAMFMGAANRDPRAWDDPDRFDIDRNPAGKHVALGAGDHICLGQNIARLEAECILSALARRIDRLELTGTPEIRLVNTLRTLKNLPLRLVA